MKKLLAVTLIALTIGAATVATTAQARTLSTAIDECQENAEVAGTAMYQWQQTGDVTTLKRQYLTLVSGDSQRTFMGGLIFDDVTTYPREKGNQERVNATRVYMRNMLSRCLNHAVKER